MKATLLKTILLSAAVFLFSSCREAATSAEAPAASDIVSIESTHDFETTYSRLKSTIEGNPKLKIVAELDHARNAKDNAGLELRPTRVIMFGNPAMGTPLMQAEQLIGLDLPQRMLVSEDAAGKVFVSFHHPQATAVSHGIQGKEDLLEKISTALNKLATKASTKGE